MVAKKPLKAKDILGCEEPDNTKAQIAYSLRKWNDLAVKHGFPKARDAVGVRRAHLLARLKEFPSFWELVQFELASLGPWARGQNFWSLDWILSPTNLRKLLEGNYRARGNELTGPVAPRVSSWHDPNKFKECV
jgi:hypothetical protein